MSGVDQTTDPAVLIDLFCRKSRAKASKGKREISISAQEARGRLIAVELGLVVRHVWREVGSASRFSTRGARKEQTAALKALERGDVGALWVYRLDRWDRRGAGAILKIIEPDDGRPRRLLFDNGDPDNPGIGLDSTNPRDRKELIRRAEDAREETEILSERVRNTKTHQRANGEWVNATAPYGLRVTLVEVEDEDGDVLDERKVEIDTAPAGHPADPTVTKADIARRAAYLLPIEGHSSRAIAALLNSEGVPSPAGGTWAQATIRDMVRNPAYAGWQTTGRQDGRNRRVLYRDATGSRVSVMTGPPLLTDAQQAEAQSALKGASGLGLPADGRPHTTRARHILTGLTRCAGCGGSMPASGRGYKCWRSSSGKTCPAPAFAAKAPLEAFVHARWFERLTNAEPDDLLVQVVADRWAANVQPQATADSKAALMALTDAEERLSQVWDDRRRGLYSGPSEGFFAPALQEASAAVLAAKQALNKSVSNLGPDVVGFLMDPNSCEDAWERADEATKRDLLKLAIDEIKITKAPGRGQPFDGMARTSFKWADGAED
jgi:DNA invertase Pin-like site-specific DNA recombinase